METPKIKFDITQAPWVECKSGNTLFETKLLFKKVSSLISPTGKEELIPIEVIVCSKCGKIPEFFFEKAKDLPLDLKSDCGE